MEIAMSMNIGFWGVGLMGRRLIKAGYNVLAYSRNLAKAREVADAGKTGSATDRVEDLAACDVLFTCLARWSMSGGPSPARRVCTAG